MKATLEFNTYRFAVFGDLMTIKQFRDLQAGKDVEIKKELVKKYPRLFVEGKKNKEVKDGN